MSSSDSSASGAGRFAPSPTGPLHLGNLRTAMLAWLFARSSGRAFIVRMEDLDRVTSSREWERHQLSDLAAIGLDWDGEVIRQSDHFDRHHAAIAQLVDAGLTFECFCTRKEIAEAASAPHGDVPRYPGTCRELTASERADRAATRSPALRLRAGSTEMSFVDEVVGTCSGIADDVVIRRNDGVPAYNLAVVVDDAFQGVDQVARGDDLLPSTPSQLAIIRLLGLQPPTYAHVPLVLGPDGERLAKRHGAITLASFDSPDAVRGLLAESLGLASQGEQPTMSMLLQRFDPAALPRSGWTLQTA